MTKVIRLTESDLVRLVERVLNEQSSVRINDLQKIVSDINYNLNGDVKGWHLDDLSNILHNKVFGKKIEGTNLCALLKVLEYFKASEGLTSGNITDRNFWTKSLGSLTGDRLGQSLLAKLAKTGEMPDDKFEGKKNELIYDIKSELNGFCKTK
jgi:hypothetical protein